MSLITDLIRKLSLLGSPSTIPMLWQAFITLNASARASACRQTVFRGFLPTGQLQIEVLPMHYSRSDSFSISELSLIFFLSSSRFDSTPPRLCEKIGL